MTGPGDPPEGPAEGIPGGDDEYRSTVFDESFVRAARIQEFSATERMRSDAQAVRTRRPRLSGSVSRQASALILLIALAFGTAVYMGIRHPYQEPDQEPVAELAVTLVPLAPPAGTAPARGTARELFDASPAAGYDKGAEGVVLPPARRTEHFTISQVMQATSLAKDFVVASSLNPDVLVEGESASVRRLLDPRQAPQFDAGLRRPRDDGRHAATGWMVRFDPAGVALADPQVRVRGSIEVAEAGAEALDVVADHTFVYALRQEDGAAGGGRSGAMLYTVRRELRMRFDKDVLRDSRLTLVESATEAGPQGCAAPGAEYFQPLFDAGADGSGEPGGTGRGGTDPYDHERPVAAACGVLAVTGPAGR